MNEKSSCNSFITQKVSKCCGEKDSLDKLQIFKSWLDNWSKKLFDLGFVIWKNE